MVIAAISFVSELMPRIAPTFEAQLTELLDSPVDEIVIAAQGAIPLVFVNIPE